MNVTLSKIVFQHPKSIYLLVLFTTLYVAGCASHKEAIEIDRSATSTEVMSMVNSLSNSLQTFSAEGSLSIDSPRLSQSAGFQLAVKKPDSLRIILEGPFGITVGQALITKEHFIAYNALQNSVYEGKTSSGFAMMKGIDISPDVIVDAATGIRRFDDDQTQPDSFYISQNNYILKFLSLAGWKVYTVDGNSQRIIRVETFNKNSN
ncbi:MAG: DUF4292 domain-containing protein, partial [Bacteroidota bacterium]|nr:DUF4292 domain-containing protein [Bacteroidota bacterium]